MTSCHSLIFVAEKNTALATFVAIFSLKEHVCSSASYHVHILTIGLTHEQECALQALSHEGFTVQTYAVDSDKEDADPQDIAGILTLQLANIFWELETALYVDAHALIQADVQDFFQLDVQSAYAALPEVGSSKVLFLHLENMRGHKIVAELMACNVSKGDYAGYERALCSVLGEKCIYLSTHHVSFASDEQGVCHIYENIQQCKQSDAWQRYAQKAQQEYAPMYAVFVSEA